MMIRQMVLAMLASLHPGADKYAEASVVDAIAAATDDPLELAELTVYAWHESQAHATPKPWSWDARGGISCGFLQLRCGLSRSPAEDARNWLAIVREHGLIAVDGSKFRSDRREAEARGLLGRLPFPSE